MRKVLLSALLLTSSLIVGAQTVTKRKVLKRTDMGNQRLEVAINGNDTVFSVVIANGSASRQPFPVILGGKAESLRLLQFLLDAELGKDDMVSLENPTNNMVRRSSSSAFTVYSEGRAFSGGLRKPNIRGFIKTIHQFCGDVPTDGNDDEDEE